MITHLPVARRQTIYLQVVCDFRCQGTEKTALQHVFCFCESPQYIGHVASANAISFLVYGFRKGIHQLRCYVPNLSCKPNNASEFFTCEAVAMLADEINGVFLEVFSCRKA